MSTLIYNAYIVDGGENLPFMGSLIINDSGRISYIGEQTFPLEDFDDTFDAGGHVLAPGFIDTHSHSDVPIFIAPEATELLAQGITTVVCGNCGMSPFPVTPKNQEALQKRYQQYGVTLSWKTFSDYAEKLRQLRPGVNLVSLLGHNTLRAAVLGYENILPNETHIETMKLLLNDALDQGCAGVSLGLIYIPGKFTTESELIETLKPLGMSQKTLTAHLRSEGDQLLESLEEFLKLGTQCCIKRCHVSHLKTALKHNWHKIDALEKQFARTDYPFELSADRYPYTEGMTSLSIILPEPWGDFSDAKIQDILQDPATYKTVLDVMQKRETWVGIRLADTRVGKYQPYLGKMLEEIAELENRSCAEIFCEILREDSINALGTFSGMSVENMNRIIGFKNVCCGSDENVKPIDFSMGRSHPRGWGSFPKFFHAARQTHSLETVIAKMSALPAQIFQIPNRGRLVEGYIADLVLFDAENFTDKADFANPHQLAQGVKRVWIHGNVAWDDNQKIEGRYGDALSIIHPQSTN